MSNTIILAGGYRKLQSLTLAAGNTPKPGSLLKLNSAGKLEVHSTDGGFAERILLLEDALQGKTVNDAYVAGTVADCGIIFSGTETQVRVPVGQNVTCGEFLYSNGAGKFVRSASLSSGSTGVPLCVATESKNLTVSGAVESLVAVRWL